MENVSNVPTSEFFFKLLCLHVPCLCWIPCCDREGWVQNKRLHCVRTKPIRAKQYAQEALSPSRDHIPH